MLTLQAALQQLAFQQTEATLGDRSTYLGASDIGAYPCKTILRKLHAPESDLVTLLRQRRGHMAEEVVAAAFMVAGFSNFQRQTEVRHAGNVPVMAHLDFVFISEVRKTMAVLEVKAPENNPAPPLCRGRSKGFLYQLVLCVAILLYGRISLESLAGSVWNWH
jgi:CRISPR-associated exonuclease Cas4